MPRSSNARIGAILCAVLFCIAQQTVHVDGANILGLFTSHSQSHLIVHMSVVRALAEQGHNVTVVCSKIPKVTHENIKVIVIPPTEEQDKEVSAQITIMATKKNSMITTIGNMFGSLSLMLDMQFQMLQDKRFTVLYENPDTHFDLVIMGYFMNDYQLGVAAKFKCPIIVDWMSSPNEMTNKLIGNPTEMAYVPSMNIPVKAGESMGFLKRMQNFFATMFFRVIGQLLDYRMNLYFTQLFPTDGSFPTYQELKKNVSLVFCNSHFSEGPIRPNVPALVEIGGIQIKEQPDPLPKDIGDFLNASATNGAILFSLGSNLQGSSIQPDKVQIIFKVLSSLKQNVIWKWEDSSKTPGNSPNILYKKWLPQDDILAHPNLKLFITHAGKGGLAEAQYHAIPMVAIPVFADQNTNADNMVSAGYGLQVNLLQLNEADLRYAVKEVIENPTYAKNVKKFSELYRDRPLTAKQNVVFWTEYVLRHHGAAHMQSPLVHLNTVESLNLDVFVLLSMIAYIFYRLMKLLVKFTCKKLCGKLCGKKLNAQTKPNQSKKVKKQ